MFEKITRLIKKLRKKSKPAYRSGHQGGTAFNMPSGTTSSIYMTNDSTNADVLSVNAQWESKPIVEEKETRIKKKPVEVVKDIVAELPKMNMANLKKQIKIVQRRMMLLEEELDVNPTDEKEALEYLRARLKWEKYGKYFRWSITTNELLDKLIKTYELRNVSFSGYYKSIPNEAIDELEHFIKYWKKVCKKEPEVRLIIDEGGEEEKKDPILLAHSPFGKWWYILGAWDKEVEYVDDIIYKGK